MSNILSFHLFKYDDLWNFSILYYEYFSFCNFSLILRKIIKIKKMEMQITH